MHPKLTLISHALCPYVQRAVIALQEKHLGFERIDIDLANKPAWFFEVSPLGKTPVLLVDGQPIFESAVICEYLEDTQAPALHPANPLERARHRAWIEFASATLNAIGALYNAPDATTFAAKADDIENKLLQIEHELVAAHREGPYFAGAAFSLVDAAFGPVFRYFDVLDPIVDGDIFRTTPQVRQWRHALQTRPSVMRAVQPNYPDLLLAFLLKRNSEISRRLLSSKLSAALPAQPSLLI